MAKVRPAGRMRPSNFILRPAGPLIIWKNTGLLKFVSFLAKISKKMALKNFLLYRNLRFAAPCEIFDWYLARKQKSLATPDLYYLFLKVDFDCQS